VKSDDLSVTHLKWLVESRSRNQRTALELFEIFETYATIAKGKMFNSTSQILVAVCFSLWRAAFLADKTGQRHAVFKDARDFLARMLTDNAINYPQDRSAREWTFNYYMNNAKDGLLDLAKRWDEVRKVLSKYEKVRKGTNAPERRWDRHQNAFESAVRHFNADLKNNSNLV
jgi:hypothetical protein